MKARRKASTVDMASMSEQLSSEQVRRIALHELLHHYERNASGLTANPNASLGGDVLEQRVSELLSALTQFTDPQERRAAVLQVLCSRKEQHPAGLPRRPA